MPERKLKLNNVEYDMDALSEDAKALVNSIKFTENELAKTEAMVAVLKTTHSRCNVSLNNIIEEKIIHLY